MNQQLPDKDQQIASVLSGNSTPSAIEELQNWQNLSDENKKIFDDSSKVWENCPNPLFQSDRDHDKMVVKDLIISQTVIQQKHDRILLRFLQVAAILIGPIMLAVGWYIGTSNRSTKELTWNTVTAPRKHIAMCTMADGTEVWLNTGSTISYPLMICRIKEK